MRKRCFLVALLFFLPLKHALAQDESAQSVHKYFQDLYATTPPERPAQQAGSGYSLVKFDMTRRTAGLKKEIFGYLPYWFASRWNLIDYNLVTTIAYFSGEVQSDGSISTTHGWPRYPGDPSASAYVVNMINMAHSHGVRVVLCLTNFSGSDIDVIVSSPIVRGQLISNVLALVKAGNGDGVNIDFEGVLNSSKSNLTLFMHELADSFHTSLPGSQVSCAPTDFDLRYSGGDWDLQALAPFVDLFFIQGYGYGYGGSTIATPVGLLTNTPSWGSLNETTLIDNVVLPRLDTSKIILGVPHFGYRWPTATSAAHSATTGSGVAFYYPDALGYISTWGRQWDSNALNPWYRYQASGQWYQGWYDDPESMGHKYQFVLDRNLHGVGMWSLGMDGSNHDIWDVLASYFADSALALRAPHQPVLACVRDLSTVTEGVASVRWFANTEPYLGGYRLYQSTNPAAFPATPILNEQSLDKNANQVLIGGLALDSTYYFKLVAVDSSRTRVSDTSDTYGLRTGGASRYLVVDGFDRSTGSWSSPKHAFAASYGDPIAAHGRSFDCADNDAVIAGLIAPSSYVGVIWFLGDESVSDVTFNSIEQDTVKALLSGGGRLLVSGSEVGYDLGRSGSPNYSLAFYSGYLKATYVGDKATGTSFYGATGSSFQGLAGQFGQVYIEDYPDYISPTGGATSALMYNASQVAGVQYAGTFGNGVVAGKLVYIAFTVETIASSATRNTLIADALDFFESNTAVQATGEQPMTMGLAQNYPNPFNPVTNIEYTVGGVRGFLPAGQAGGLGVSNVRLAVYDILGQEVAVLVNEKQTPGNYAVTFDGTTLSTGTYFYRLDVNGESISRRMILVK